jgi:hypothetical protein
MKRYLRYISVAIVICSIYGYFWGYQTYVAAYTLYSLRGESKVNQTPIELVLISPNCQNILPLTFYGYNFYFPWTEIKERMEMAIYQSSSKMGSP